MLGTASKHNFKKQQLRNTEYVAKLDRIPITAVIYSLNIISHDGTQPYETIKAVDSCCFDVVYLYVSNVSVSYVPAEGELGGGGAPSK